MIMELLQAINVSASVKADVSEIIASNNIHLDSPWQDYEILNAAIKEGRTDVANQLLDFVCTVNKHVDSMEPSDTPLHNAVELGDIQLVEKLLEKSPSVTAIDSYTNTPLHLAFLHEHYDIVNLILWHIEETSSYDDIINKDGLTHLHIACAQGYPQLVYSFDYVGANINSVVSNSSEEYAGYTCLQFACNSRCLETIKVVSKAIKLLGYCSDKKKSHFYWKKHSRNWSRSMIERHHVGYCGLFNERNEKYLSKFQTVCFYGDASKVEQFLEKGEDVNAPMTRNAEACPLFTPLHLAVNAVSDRQKVVELLLAHGADVDLKNGFCMTPLHCALYNDPYGQAKSNHQGSDQDNTLKVIYEAVNDKEANPMDPFGLTYFHAAVALNDMEMVKKFIETGQADCEPILSNSYNFSKYTPLHFAAKYGHEDMAKLLIEQGADINANEDQNHFDTPLQVAIEYGQSQMIDFLLAHGANPKVVAYEENKSTMHLLVDRFGDCEDEKPGLLRLVGTLIRFGVNVNAVDSDNATPLHDACSKINEGSEIVFELLNQGADINVLDKNDRVPFRKAMLKDPEATFDVLLRLYYHVKKLKQLGVKVDARNDKFCEKVMEKKEEWQKSEKWPVIEQMCSDEELTRRQQEWIEEIEKLKVDMLNENVSVYDYLRMEPKEAVEFAKNERIEKLVADDQLRSVYAAYGYLIPVAHRNSLRSLESQQPKQEEKMQEDSVFPAEDFETPIYRPKKAVNPSEDEDQQQLPVNVSLQDAIKLGKIKWVEELLAKGASTKFVDDKKNGPLHLAFVFNHGKIADLLLSRMKENSEYANWQNDQGITQLHIAAARGNAIVVEKLLDNGANPTDLVYQNSPIYPGRVALQLACDFKRLEAAKVLTKAMKPFGNVTDENAGAFAAFSESTQYRMMGPLLALMFREKEPLTEFHEACYSSPVADVSEFLNRRVDVNAPMNANSKNHPLNTPLHFAIESSTDRQKKVELLLRHGADVNRTNALGMTSVHFAFYHDDDANKLRGRFEKRKELDNTLQILHDAVKDREANPMDAFGLTYFHIAVARNDLLFAKRMLFRGEDVNASVLPNVHDYSSYTPLHFAARFGHKEMAKLLIDRGAKVQADDEDDSPRYPTPLQLAIINGKCGVIDILLKHGANTRVVQPTSKKTTLHLMADRFGETSMENSKGQDEKSDLEWFVEKLVKGGASVDAKDADGFTALHSSCANLSECHGMVRWLLHMGADINIKVKGKTALDFANKSWFRKNFDDFFTLYAHVQKLKDLGLEVDPRNEKYCEKLLKDWSKWQDDEDIDFFKDLFSAESLEKEKQQRLDEIRALQRDMLTDEVSVYDYIRMSEKQAVAFLGNERLRKIDDIVEAERTFGENFGYLVPVVYRKSQKWQEDQRVSKKTTAGKPPVLKTRSAKRKRS